MVFGGHTGAIFNTSVELRRWGEFRLCLLSLAHFFLSFFGKKYMNSLAYGCLSFPNHLYLPVPSYLSLAASLFFSFLHGSHRFLPWPVKQIRFASWADPNLRLARYPGMPATFTSNRFYFSIHVSPPFLYGPGVSQTNWVIL